MTELGAYDEEAKQLQTRLREIPADIESQRLTTALTGIHTHISALLEQAEQGRTTLEQARQDQERRGQEIHAYKLFLEETDAWLRSVVSKIHEQYSLDANKVCWIALLVGITCSLDLTFFIKSKMSIQYYLIWLIVK